MITEIPIITKANQGRKNNDQDYRPPTNYKQTKDDNRNRNRDDNRNSNNNQKPARQIQAPPSYNDRPVYGNQGKFNEPKHGNKGDGRGRDYNDRDRDRGRENKDRNRGERGRGGHRGGGGRAGDRDRKDNRWDSGRDKGAYQAPERSGVLTRRGGHKGQQSQRGGNANH